MAVYEDLSRAIVYKPHPGATGSEFKKLFSEAKIIKDIRWYASETIGRGSNPQVKAGLGNSVILPVCFFAQFATDC